MCYIAIPDNIEACLFDLDGVLTKTDILHGIAWKEMFDAYVNRPNDKLTAFNPAIDYIHVDGMPRMEGVRNFLRSRGVHLPDGDPLDPIDMISINGLGNRKNMILQRLIREGGVESYEGSIRFVQAVRKSGMRTAVVSSSANCQIVLEAAKIANLFEIRVDAQAAVAKGLLGKPHPDTYIEAANLLGVQPRNAAVFEDTSVGVEAGKSGFFGYVVGVDRGGRRRVLYKSGADQVVNDLFELLDLSRPGCERIT